MKKILPYLIILFLGCATKPEPLPDWVLHTKNNSENWQSVGIGLTRDIAINQAINSIATQISVQIESKIKSIKAERNYELQEFSRSIVESRVNISLPEVEIEEIINSNNFWYAKAKLNKDKYYKLLEQKRQNAKETALKILQDSKQLNKLDELKSIFMAYLEIKNYLDMPMLMNYNGQSNINLYSEIISLFKKCVQYIQILPEKNKYNLKSVIPLRKKIPIQIKSTDNKSVEGLPFLVQFNSGKTNSNLSVINNSIQLIIDEVYPQKSSDILSIKLDIKSMCKFIVHI